MQIDSWLRELGRTAGAALLLGCAAIMLPLPLFGVQGIKADYKTEAVLPAVPSPVAAPSPQDEPTTSLSTDRSRMVRVLGSGEQVQTMTMEDYLWGVIAAEMPASFEPEALKAQAVAARTYTVWKTLHAGLHEGADICTNPNCCQAWIQREDVMARWGADGPDFADKLSRAVADTDGKILLSEGEPIQAAFHASSAGKTEDAAAVWGTQVPYLVGVDTPEGDEVPNYRTVVTLSPAEVKAALAPLGCQFSRDASEWFQELRRSETGRVEEANIGGVTLRGSAIRAALGLRSPAFEVLYQDGSFTFTVTGYGHGVGLSQYGANALAKEGKNWKEIVTWYYTGVAIGDYSAIPAAGTDRLPSDGD